jgi:predicted GNAT family N-acyltransferase
VRLAAVDLIYHLETKHIEELHRLYQNESWSKGRTLEQTQHCVSGSSICIAMLDRGGNLAAFARVLTDYIFKALIFDVIVDTNYRGEGLGSTLINAVKSHPELSGVKHFELYCLDDLDEFYRKHGFSTDVSNMHLMRYVRPDC